MTGKSSRYRFVDVQGDVHPGKVLRASDPEAVYVVPWGRPWAALVRRHLQRRNRRVLTTTDTVEIGGLPFPARPPWIYLEGGAIFRRGGMSVLYRYRDRRDGAARIVKVIAFRQALDLAMSELVLARKEVPGLFPVLEIAQVADDVYILMPEADGDAWSGGATVRRTLQRTAEALVHLHRAGWVHCDVKPANILIYGSRPYLADPGIAVPAGTLLRRVRCSLRFAPPEWIEAYREKQPVRIDASADVYSFAMTALTLLLGAYPLGDLTEGELLLAYLHGGIHRRCAEMARRIPGALGGVLSSALVSEPPMRPVVEAILSALKEQDRREAHHG